MAAAVARGGAVSHSHRPTRNTHFQSRQMVGRHFAAAAPNEVWVTDITYIRTREGWLYAVAESFWSTIKAELIELADFPTGAAARLAIFEYADRSPG
jgi:transposase InsO family protein